MNYGICHVNLRKGWQTEAGAGKQDPKEFKWIS